MKILIKTEVEQDYRKVFEGFDESLFMELKPPLLPLKLLRFDGSRKGDEVHIQLGAGFVKQRWDALITEDGEKDGELYFIDKGIQLPFFLKDWKHHHRVLESGEGAIIIDEIYFKSPFFLFDYLLYPILYLQFYARKPVYKRVFKRKP